MAHDQRSPMVAKIRQRSPTFVGLNSRRRRRRKSRRHRRRDAAAHAERERAAVSRPAPFLFVSLLFWFLFGFFFFDPSLLLCSVSFFFSKSQSGRAAREEKKNQPKKTKGKRQSAKEPITQKKITQKKIEKKRKRERGIPVEIRLSKRNEGVVVVDKTIGRSDKRHSMQSINPID